MVLLDLRRVTVSSSRRSVNRSRVGVFALKQTALEPHKALCVILAPITWRLATCRVPSQQLCAWNQVKLCEVKFSGCKALMSTTTFLLIMWSVVWKRKFVSNLLFNYFHKTLILYVLPLFSNWWQLTATTFSTDLLRLICDLASNNPAKAECLRFFCFLNLLY